MKVLQVLAVASLLAACASGGGGSIEPTPTPQTTAEVVVPVTGTHVKAAIASATLGDEGCDGTSSGQRPASLAACDAGTTADASPDAAVAKSSDAVGGCGGGGFTCKASTVQIQFTTSGGSAPARVEIDEVLLVDTTNDATLATLTTSSPKSWDDATSTYRTWDESLAPTAVLKSSYTLSPIAWSKLSTSSTSRSSAGYRLIVTLRIGGVVIKLQSATLQREPMVAT